MSRCRADSQTQTTQLLTQKLASLGDQHGLIVCHPTNKFPLELLSLKGIFQDWCMFDQSQMSINIGRSIDESGIT